MIALLLLTTAICFDPTPVEDDSLASSLKASKDAYARNLDALKEPTLEWFESEAKARTGNKLLLSELEGWRTSFDKNGDPPAGLAAPLRRRYAEAAARLEGLYDYAIREYRRAKLAEKAEATAKEWLQFRIDGRGTMQPEIRDGVPHLIIAKCSKLALTIDPPPGSAESAIVVQRPPNEADEAQHWHVSMKRAGSTALLSFQLRKYDLWMHVQSGSRENGAAIVLWHRDGVSKNERWVPLQDGNWLNLHGADSGRLLGVPEGRSTPGTQIIQWHRSNQDDQRFRILPIRVTAK